MARTLADIIPYQKWIYFPFFSSIYIITNNQIHKNLTLKCHETSNKGAMGKLYEEFVQIIHLATMFY